MPTILRLLLLITLFLAFSPCHAEEISGVNREVRAGIFNFDGYHAKDEDGRLGGYGIDLLRLLSEYSHLNFEFAGYDNSWQDMQDMLKNGEIDIVSSARRSPEREEVFAFSLPVGRNHTVLSKQLYNTKLRAGEYSTYNGMRIGVVAGSSQNRHLPEFAKDKGFTYEVVEFASPKDLAKALQQGDVDAILSSNLRKPEDETVLDIIRSDNFYIVARKEDQDLIDEINYAIEQMNLNEGDWQSDLYYRHYGPKISNMPRFSRRERAYMDDVTNGKKTITAIARPDMPPYSYVKDGVLTGILPDYFAKAMQVAGLPYELITPKTPEDYAKKADSGSVDIVLDRLKPDLPAHNNSYRGFSTNPYMVTGLARVTRMDFNGPIKTLALWDKTPLEMQSALLRNVNVKRYATPQDAMDAVEKGEADAAYVLPYIAQLYVNRAHGNSLYYSMMNDRGASFRMYVPAGTEHELITILNKSIKGLPAGILNQLASRYIAFDAGEMSIGQYLHANPGITVAGALAIMLTASLIFFMWLRGRWNRKLLSSTEYANQQLEGQLAIVEALSRDYSNVLAINPERATTSIVKIFGYVAPDKPDAPREEKPYEQILEAYIKQKVHPDDRKWLSQALSLPAVEANLATREEYTGTYRIVDEDKTQHYQFTFVRQHQADNRNDDLILAGFRNIDDVIRREQEQKKTLADALAKARYASAAKTAFLNNMSHDIRTPMNAIIGFTTLAAANVRNAPMVQRYLGKIMTSGNHLLNLINDVLDMSRIESGKVKIEEVETELPEIIHDLRTIVQADVRSKQLVFQIDTFNVRNETIYCDRLHINQVLLNILSNAIKYTAPGGKVGVRITQTSKPDKGIAGYEFRISDTGIGMSEKFLEHVFEPFERERTSTVSGIQGTGLGLAITKKIVDMMGGSISVTSQAGEGSEFTVRFKFRIVSPQNAYAAPEKFRGTRALIVDGEDGTCPSLAPLLAELEISPDCASSATEALKMASDKSYAICFVDLTGRDKNRIELVRQLRNRLGKDTPIIILTPYDWTDIEEEARASGATAFMARPVFLSELHDLLKDPDQEVSEEEEEKRHPELFQGKRILLAEDNEMNQEIAQMILEDAGFTLDIVENGQEALEKIRTSPAGTYELILMDVQMPVMNGYEATRAIRSLDDADRASIPIIAMTANAFDEDREEAISSGMNGYVAKPIDIQHLMETLEEILGGSN